MNRKQKKRRLIIKKYLFQFLNIAVGTALMAIGISQFLLPNQLSSGGFAGVATITYYLFHFPVGITILLLNIPLFILAYLKFGNKFIARTIIGTMLLSFFIDIFDKLPELTEDRFLACIYGGIVVGIGTAIILKVNSSTGGSDLLSYIVNYYNKQIRPGNVIVALDTIVVVLNAIFFKHVEIGLYSAITIYIMGKMLDIVFEGVNFTKILFIISKDYEKIAEEIGKEVRRGSTGIYAKGMYTNEEKMMLFCVGSRSEIIKIKNISYKIDPNCFIVISNARETYGKGFKEQKKRTLKYFKVHFFYIIVIAFEIPLFYLEIQIGKKKSLIVNIFCFILFYKLYN